MARSKDSFRLCSAVQVVLLVLASVAASAGAITARPRWLLHGGGTHAAKSFLPSGTPSVTLSPSGSSPSVSPASLPLPHVHGGGPNLSEREDSRFSPASPAAASSASRSSQSHSRSARLRAAAAAASPGASAPSGAALPASLQRGPSLVQLQGTPAFSGQLGAGVDLMPDSEEDISVMPNCMFYSAYSGSCIPGSSHSPCRYCRAKQFTGFYGAAQCPSFMSFPPELQALYRWRITPAKRSRVKGWQDELICVVEKTQVAEQVQQQMHQSANEAALRAAAALAPGVPSPAPGPSPFYNPYYRNAAATHGRLDGGGVATLLCSLGSLVATLALTAA
ncbi:hypothetical protein BESB_014700 [Besnoitia besnoiti]|uniref:Transmembrane protein n=1 Tax=Besnoitia besnoiti TaxID=94643 RepID=A0A2A9MB59_BESBE|nr:hypothetical protein BESB_014700 [Besnoitia besnoiti]PFH32857.1 hypothetical protein BESB_014700 [Besnoitia besnoiti]